MTDAARTAIALLLTIAIGAGGCSREAAKGPEDEATAADAGLAALDPPDHACAPGKEKLPPEGAVFRYELVDSAGRPKETRVEETIKQVAGSRVVALRAAFRGKDRNRGWSQRTVRLGGVLPGPLDSPLSTTERSYRFDDDALERLERLSPGDEIVLQGLETTEFNASQKLVSGAARIKLLGCGHLKVAGQDESVRLYRVAMFGRSYSAQSSDPHDNVVVETSIVYVSERLGWWLGEDGQNGGRIRAVAIVLPR